MDERGWAWTNSQIRQARLVEWLAYAADEVHVEPFYAALPDWLSNDDRLGDAKALKERGLIEYRYPVGGMVASVTPAGQDHAETLHTMRKDARKRRAACRDAMVAWLCSRDATSSATSPAVDQMPADPRHGVWLAEPFTSEDIDAAAAWLHEHGLVAGRKAAGRKGPLRGYLTAAGIVCAEKFDSDTRRYIDVRNAPVSAGPTVNIGTNSGAFQVAGDQAYQVQNTGPSAEHLRELITSIAELVRQQVSDVDDIDAEQQAALAAVSDGEVDQTALRRFGVWVLSAVCGGATAATVAEVSSMVSAMYQTIARLTGHLG